MREWQWSRYRANQATGALNQSVRLLAVLAPWLTVLILLVMFHFVGSALSVSEGVLFDLPTGEATDSVATDLVAVVLPTAHDTLVLFDDVHYLLTDAGSMEKLGESLREKADTSHAQSVLVLADRRVSGSDLMHLAEVVRGSGLKRVLFAEKRDWSAK